MANSWATSISSRSLTLRQAYIGAAIFEFLGAVTVGARVASTIKNGIIVSGAQLSLSFDGTDPFPTGTFQPAAAFDGNAGVQLLSFTVAIVASASWLMFATYMSFPVSTTYSIVSAVAGVGVAVAGADQVQWGWNNANGGSLLRLFAL